MTIRLAIGAGGGGVQPLKIPKNIVQKKKRKKISKKTKFKI